MGSGRFLGAAVALAALGCGHATEGGRTMRLTTPAAPDGGPLPRQYTCDGPDLSPPLAWDGVPEGVASFALVVDDPDAPAGTWVHWVLYDVPPATRALPQDVPRAQHLADGSRQGRNDFGRLGWAGPCPPPGAPHRYFFRLYALDRRLGLAGGATRAELDAAMAGHVLGEAVTMARYARAR